MMVIITFCMQIMGMEIVMTMRIWWKIKIKIKIKIKVTMAAARSAPLPTVVVKIWPIINKTVLSI